jgi:hypothetical protein
MNHKKCLILLVALLSCAVFADDAAPAGPTSSKNATEVVGTKADWQIYLTQTLQYAKIREMVRNAYIEVETWKAIKANWQRQKNWFDRNVQRWDRIKQNLNSVATKGTIFQKMRRMGDVTNSVDNFVVVQTQQWDDIMQTYEDNASQMWDVAASYSGNRMIPAEQVWKKFNTLCQIYGINPSNPTQTPPDVSEVFALPAWQRRKFLGKSLSLMAAQNSGIQMQRAQREAFWQDFTSQIQAAQQPVNGKDPLADAINAEDILRRTQTLADVNDLIIQKTIETQLLMTRASDNTYQQTGEMYNIAQGVNEVNLIKKYVTTGTGI